MSSQEGNQADATNWIIITEKETQMQRFYGPFSSALEHRDSEANVFATQILESRQGLEDPNLRSKWKDEMIKAAKTAFAQPDWQRPFPVWAEGSNIDLETQKITLN